MNDTAAGNAFDAISEALTVAACATVVAAVLAVPFYGFPPLAVVLVSLLAVAAVAKVLLGD